MSQTKKRIAFFFGGRSPEHDVSVVSALQAMQAVDQSQYETFPVYITTEGKWLTGDVLRKRENYLLDANNLKQTQQVTIDVTPSGQGVLLPVQSGLFKAKPITFDVAVPAFHGLIGEDGCIQGLFETAGIPYTGMRVMASSILMDKGATKHVLKGLGIPCLPYAILSRPAKGYLIPDDELKALVKDTGFPCIIKPSHLGSSIGVAKADSLEELSACLPAVFEYDTAAIVEPFVQNLVEYNVAISRFSGEVKISAIERPKTQDELLDFKQKYLSGGDNKSGTKNPGEISEGMLSLTRELNPVLDESTKADMKDWAVRMFEGLGGTGAPRIDFIGDSKTGKVWLNEVNPCPGSFGYFLWEAADEPVLFTAFMSALIEEAIVCAGQRKLPKDPVPVDARLFKRPL